MDVKVERKAATLDHCDPWAFVWTGCSEEVAAVHVFQCRKKKKQSEMRERKQDKLPSSLHPLMPTMPYTHPNNRAAA